MTAKIVQFGATERLKAATDDVPKGTVKYSINVVFDSDRFSHIEAQPGSAWNPRELAAVFDHMARALRDDMHDLTADGRDVIASVYLTTDGDLEAWVAGIFSEAAARSGDPREASEWLAAALSEGAKMAGRVVNRQAQGHAKR